MSPLEGVPLLTFTLRMTISLFAINKSARELLHLMLFQGVIISPH